MDTHIATNHVPPVPALLEGVCVLLFALNVPGPVAAARLRTLGATVVKIEPPQGDPLNAMCPAWYEELHAGFATRRLDLRTDVGKDELERLLAGTDLLMTSFRPSSLERLNLGRAQLSLRFPDLCQVAIVGEGGVRADIAGHDLTYQSIAGMLTPPAMPRTLLADLSGAERAVSAALMLLLARARGFDHALAEISLADSVKAFAAPLTHGLTSAAGILGGAYPFYRMYRSSDGWIAVAALEPSFSSRLTTALNVVNPSIEQLAAIFLREKSSTWQAWAQERDVPIVAVDEDR